MKIVWKKECEGLTELHMVLSNSSVRKNQLATVMETIDDIIGGKAVKCACRLKRHTNISDDSEKYPEIVAQLNPHYTGKTLQEIQEQLLMVLMPFGEVESFDVSGLRTLH